MTKVLKNVFLQASLLVAWIVGVYEIIKSPVNWRSTERNVWQKVFIMISHKFKLNYRDKFKKIGDKFFFLHFPYFRIRLWDLCQETVTHFSFVLSSNLRNLINKWNRKNIYQPQMTDTNCLSILLYMHMFINISTKSLFQCRI